VFVGSPFNNAPFSSLIEYTDFSLVVRISDISDWVRTPDHNWQVQNWHPDTKVTHTIPTAEGLLPTIRSISPARVKKMQQALAKVRGHMLYKTVLDPDRPSAVDLLLQLVEAAH